MGADAEFVDAVDLVGAPGRRQPVVRVVRARSDSGGKRLPHRGDTITYLAFAVASAVVAASGLLLDSAVVGGAMVIAPFGGSTLSASVGAVVDAREMVVDSATSQLGGRLVAYVGGVATSVFLRRSGFVPATLEVGRIGQGAVFATPNLLTLAIVLSVGLAGALAHATDLPVSIAGVAVPAAIVPAGATVGVGTAWGDPATVAKTVRPVRRAAIRRGRSVRPGNRLRGSSGYSPSVSVAS